MGTFLDARIAPDRAAVSAAPSGVMKLAKHAARFNIEAYSPS